MSKKKISDKDDKKNKKKKKAVNEEAKSIDTLEVARKAIRKKYGSNIIKKLSDHEDLSIDTISTGSLRLDACLGRGGLGRGRVYEFYGPNSSGKTTLSAHVLVQAQKKGLRTGFVDAEHALDPKLFRNYGIDPEKLDVVQCFGGEANLDATEMLAVNGCDVVVVDSVAALVPEAEVVEELTKQQMGIHARLMSKALRRLVPIINETNTLLIFINQIRQKIGVVYGNPETTPGGEALGFYSTGRIRLVGGKGEAFGSDKNDINGHTTSLYVKKNKLSAPYKKCSLRLIYGKGFDIYEEIFQMSVDYGLIEQSGAWYSIDGNNIAQGTNNCINHLIENNDLYNELRKEIIIRTGLSEYYE
jgi:recombination protein RecA